MNTDASAELRVEMITAALLVVAVGVFLLRGDLFDPLGLLVVGAILLGSAIYQTRRGWPVSLITWALGVLLTLGGLGLKLFLVAFMQVNYIALGLLAIGGWWLYRTLFRKG